MHATMTATHDPETLPRWDLDSIFPGPESPQFREALQEATNHIADLVSQFDRHGIGSRSPGPVDAATVAAFDEIVAAYDAALALAYRLDGYLSCLTADDSRNEAARAAESEWRAIKTGACRRGSSADGGSGQSSNPVTSCSCNW